MYRSLQNVMVIYCCFTNHPQTQQLKITTFTSFYLSQFWWLTGQFRVFYEIAVRYSSQGCAHLKACFIHMSGIWAEKIFLKAGEWSSQGFLFSVWFLLIVFPYGVLRLPRFPTWLRDPRVSIPTETSKTSCRFSIIQLWDLGSFISMVSHSQKQSHRPSRVRGKQLS